MTRACKTIALWGHFADANLGDEAPPTAVLHHLRRMLPEAKFVLICRFPHIAQATYGLPAYPIARLRASRTGPWQPPPVPPTDPDDPSEAPSTGAWRGRLRRFLPLRVAVLLARAAWQILRSIGPEARFLWRSYRTLQGVDLLIVTGSGPIFDYFGGFWGFPVTVWKWATLTRLTGTRLAFASVGAGPIGSRRSGRLLARALRHAEYVAFRDQRSRLLMEKHGYSEPSVVRPDLAHSLPRPEAAPAAPRPLRVGINPMIVHNPTFWPGSDETVYQRYIKVLAALAIELERDGCDVFFYGTQKDDGVASAEVQAAIEQAEPLARVPAFVFPASVDALAGLSSGADILVTTRFHGAVFGVMTCTPTVAICYQAKTLEVMEQAGIEEFAFAFEDINAAQLREALDAAVARRRDITAALRRHAVVTRTQLDEQYKWLAELLGPT